MEEAIGAGVAGERIVVKCVVAVRGGRSGRLTRLAYHVVATGRLKDRSQTFIEGAPSASPQCWQISWGSGSAFLTEAFLNLFVFDTFSHIAIIPFGMIKYDS